MRKLLGTLVLLAAVVAGFGYYRGWFTVSREEGGDDKTHINLTINKDKITDDVKKTEKAIEGVGKGNKDG